MDYSQIDPNAKENQGDFNRSVIEPGRYQVVLFEAVEKEAKSGKGVVLHLTFSVLGGDYNGEHVMAFPIVDHEERKHVMLGRKQIASIMQASGVSTISRPEDLITNKPIMVDVEIENNFNRIVAYHRINGGSAPPPPPRQQTAAKTTRSRDEIPF